jgi:glutaredoxin
MATIKVYGADWCSMTTRSITFLEDSDVEFEYIDVEEDPEASEWVKAQNNGKEKKPTIDVDGEILSEPSNSELRAVLEKKKLLKAS